MQTLQTLQEMYNQDIQQIKDLQKRTEVLRRYLWPRDKTRTIWGSSKRIRKSRYLE